MYPVAVFELSPYLNKGRLIMLVGDTSAKDMAAALTITGVQGVLL